MFNKQTFFFLFGQQTTITIRKNFKTFLGKQAKTGLAGDQSDQNGCFLYGTC